MDMADDAVYAVVDKSKKKKKNHQEEATEDSTNDSSTLPDYSNDSNDESVLNDARELLESINS